MNNSQRKKGREEVVDFPINGRVHPAVIRHRKVMKSLKSNEIIFTSHQLIELLDDPENGHFTSNYLANEYGTNSALNPHIPIPPKGIYIKRAIICNII